MEEGTAAGYCHRMDCPTIKTMIKKKNIKSFLGFICLVCLWGCNGFLDEKPSISLAIPQTLDDFQALLDAEPSGMYRSPSLGLLSADDLVLGNALLQQVSFAQRAAYYWEDEVFLDGTSHVSWSAPYTKIFYANVVLDGLESYTPASAEEESRMKVLEASAKFFRAMGHFEVLGMYSQPYEEGNPDQLGIPIRLTSDINVKTGRATQREVYEQIIEDLKSGLEILPVKEDRPVRPSVWASEALLSKVYLTMKDYENTYLHAKNALMIDDTLMDYNSLDPSSNYSFELFNPEVIFYRQISNSRVETNANTFVNPDLLTLYDSADLRLEYFLKPARTEGMFTVRGRYTGDFYYFSGLAVDEVMLDMAEAAARLGKTGEAVELLNRLNENRYKMGSFIPLEEMEESELMGKIVEERRKELFCRGVRWSDLRRYNSYPELAVTLSRKFNPEKEEIVMLPPDSPKYALPIPPLEIQYNPMVQNPR